MIQKNKLLKRNTIVAVSVVAISIVVAAGFVLVLNRPSLTKADEIHKPSFSFEQSKAPGWWSGGNNWPDINDYTGGQVTEAELPVADINVLKGTRNTPGECFVMAFYNRGSIDIATAVKKKETEIVLGDRDSSALKQIANVAQSIETSEGKKEYTLYQYDYNKPQVQRGNEFGFVPLKKGHIEIRGICATAEQLQTTLTPLSAIRLNL